MFTSRDQQIKDFPLWSPHSSITQTLLFFMFNPFVGAQIPYYLGFLDMKVSADGSERPRESQEAGPGAGDLL